MTAIEWLKGKTSDMTIHKTHLNDTISEWQDGYNVALEDVIKLLNQAIQMEKQQIENAYVFGFKECEKIHEEAFFIQDLSEQYYNETYKKITYDT
jgi:hypothetical protein